MKQRLTPNYTHEKISKPTYADLVDVFEDAWKGYVLSPAQVVLNSPHGDIAAITLLSPYFESIETLYQGRASEGNSRDFFVAGFLRVFEKISGLDGATDTENAAKTIYKHVRCGVAHTGFPTYRVGFHRTNPNAFILTYRRLPDGCLDTVSPVSSILINAQRIHDAVAHHLDQYVLALRRPKSTMLHSNFNCLMRSSWGMGEDDNVVAMTEEQFANHT